MARYSIVISLLALVWFSCWVSQVGWAQSGAGLYDPMRPQVALVNTNPADNGKGDGDVKFRLEAIVVSGRQRTAVINGIGVSVGESIEGCRVKAITADAVLLAGKQGNKKLTLLSDDAAKMSVKREQ